MTLSIYDTLTRTVKPVSSSNGRTTMYCCGPTVYRDAHVGNLRTFVLSDLIRRSIEITGGRVELIQNITDVGHMSQDVIGEDKMLTQAEAENKDPFKMAREYEANFHKDLALLNVITADKYPRASESIDLMIAMITQLISKGFAYVGSDGSVYFDAHAYESYGQISGNHLDALKPGHRFEYSDETGKGFHADWALWKNAGARTQMIWDSPWGPGFPGWHIECSAMSMEFLNNHVDVHIGGIDLRFPHHENERAQSNSFIGTETVDLWVHGEHLLFEGGKMSKSSGNVVLLSDLIARDLDPLAARLCFLENRFRSQMDLTWASLESANMTLAKWRKKMAQWGDSLEKTVDQEFLNAIETDLDAPRALQRLRAVEKSTQIGDGDKRAIFIYADKVLGLDLARTKLNKAISQEQQSLLDARLAARAQKRWSDSDVIRAKLEASGLEISDSADGHEWSWR
ncbi:MAG: cysteine--tRNA ligase [Actinomycetota bacterium]|nr:cysteine--tRNA ligase [Actinomycetota bacterium]